MKEGVSPAIAIAIIVVLLAVVIYFGWKKTGPNQAPVDKPVDMGAMMNKQNGPQAYQSHGAGGPSGGGSPYGGAPRGPGQ